MAFTYLVIDSFAIMFLLIIYTSTREQSTGLSENRCFCLIVLMTIAALLGDLMAWQLDGQSGLLCRNLLWFFNILCYVISGLMTLAWFYYVGLKLNLNSHITKPGWVLIALPCALLTVLSVLTPWLHWLFDLDANNVYVRGDLFFIQMLIPFGYLAAAALRAGMQARRERLRQQRLECLYLSSFILFPFLGGILQLSVYGLSLSWPCAALSLLLVYVNLQSQKISLDALTGLNNRGQFDKYLYGCMERIDENLPFALFILDIDEFKMINDKLGHIAGDAALISAAEILKKAFANSNAFLARYGGDEFAVVLYCSSEKQAEDRLVRIEQESQKFNLQSDAPPYRLVFSAGYVCSDKHRFKSYQDMITAADAHMYLQKQQHKAQRAADSAAR